MLWLSGALPTVKYDVWTAPFCLGSSRPLSGALPAAHSNAGQSTAHNTVALPFCVWGHRTAFVAMEGADECFAAACPPPPTPIPHSSSSRWGVAWAVFRADAHRAAAAEGRLPASFHPLLILLTQCLRPRISATPFWDAEVLGVACASVFVWHGCVPVSLCVLITQVDDGRKECPISAPQGPPIARCCLSASSRFRVGALPSFPPLWCFCWVMKFYLVA